MVLVRSEDVRIAPPPFLLPHPNLRKVAGADIERWSVGHQAEFLTEKAIFLRDFLGVLKLNIAPSGWLLI